MQNDFNDINELRKHYAELDFSQKKEFIVNLKNKAKTPMHKQLLEECVRSYNEEVRARNKEAGFEPKPKMPDISPDTFAKAFATLVKGGVETEASIKTRLLGKWQREPDDGDFFYRFNADGSFETNEFDGAPTDGGLLRGNFSVSPDNIVLMEPHEQLRFKSLMLSQSGDSLIIQLKDGLTFEYRMIKTL
ncbi:MAG: hypothetical protein FWF81_09260 [Defluviitaleaceae bacterium]|nr:hypothetical protein [Defluviitaleaceae bacterium]